MLLSRIHDFESCIETCTEKMSPQAANAVRCAVNLLAKGKSNWVTSDNLSSDNITSDNLSLLREYIVIAEAATIIQDLFKFILLFFYLLQFLLFIGYINSYRTSVRIEIASSICGLAYFVNYSQLRRYYSSEFVRLILLPKMNYRKRHCWCRDETFSTGLKFSCFILFYYFSAVRRFAKSLKI